MSTTSSVPDAASVAKTQKLLLLGGGTGLFALLLLMMWLADDAKPVEEQPTTAAKVEQVEAVARKISEEEIWTAKADAALQDMRRNNEATKQAVEQIKRENDELKEHLRTQQEEVRTLRETANKLPLVPSTNLDGIVPPPPSSVILPPANAAGVPQANLATGLPDAGSQAQVAPPTPVDTGVVHIVVDNEPSTSGTPVEDNNAPQVSKLDTSAGDNPSKPLVAPEAVTVASTVGARPLPQKRERPKSTTYIPSGSFFKAQLVASLDAPTGGNAEQNPHPVLLLVTENAFLPNKFRSKVKQCHVLASGYGDISSERVNLRTEKLSCVLRDGTVIDTKLDAYIAGEDGKAGLRGNLVSKQGALIANAMLAGTLGGIGQGLAQAATTVNQSGTGAVTTVSPDKIMDFGVYSGSGNALNKLADYYIKAAEKTFPILEVAAGRDVTVILLSGVDIAAEGIGYDNNAAADKPGVIPIVTAADQAQAGKTRLRGEE